MRFTAILLVWYCCASAQLFCGCDQNSSIRNSEKTNEPLQDLQDAVRLGQWDTAWLFSDRVREKYSEDADILAQLAWVAFKCEHFDESADLLISACRAESFSREERVQQAFLATIQGGRLFDGLDFLGDVLKAQPEQLGTRRLIYDLLMGLEDRSQAIPHGRYLVRKRKFDSELLASLCNVSRNASNDEAWKSLVDRNPRDKRPLIPQVMIDLSKGLYADAIELLQEILASHPENVQAQVLLGEAYVRSGDFSPLSKWADRLQGNYENEVGYWVTMGEWKSQLNDHAGSARAYWKASRLDPLALAAWQGLREELGHLPSHEFQVSEETNDAIGNRIEELGHLKQVKDRFVKSRSISRELAVEISTVLVNLGRLWEAEAWLAIATKLPDDPSVDVDAARQAVQSRLTVNTPWQLDDGHVEMQLDLSSLKSITADTCWRSLLQTKVSPNCKILASR